MEKSGLDGANEERLLHFRKPAQSRVAKKAGVVAGASFQIRYSFHQMHDLADEGFCWEGRAGLLVWIKVRCQ